MIDKLLTMIKDKTDMTPVKADDIASMKVGPMKFAISCYDLQGIGRMSVMQGKAMLGLMKMDTVMITPAGKDAPLISYDRILAMGNDTLIIEVYDTCVNHADCKTLGDIKGKYSSLPERDPGAHWYDSIKYKESISRKGKKVTDKMDALAMEYMTEYMNIIANAPEVDFKAKQKKNAEYVDGLLSNGGPSTDQFVKAIGKEKTSELFRNYLFGIK